MKAKFIITKIIQHTEIVEVLELKAFTEKPFDNDFSRFTPDAQLTMTIQNPKLIGTFKVGQKFNLDLTPAE